MKGLARCSTKSSQFARQQLCNNRLGQGGGGKAEAHTRWMQLLPNAAFPRPKTNRQRVLSGLTTYKHKPARWFCEGRNPLLRNDKTNPPRSSQHGQLLQYLRGTGCSWEKLFPLPFPSAKSWMRCIVSGSLISSGVRGPVDVCSHNCPCGMTGGRGKQPATTWVRKWKHGTREYDCKKYGYTTSEQKRSKADLALIIGPAAKLPDRSPLLQELRGRRFCSTQLDGFMW